jgi:hypothetical protein
MYTPHTSAPPPGTTLRGQWLLYSKSDDFPEVNSLDVVDFPCPPLLIPQLHQMTLRCIGTGMHDTMAPSAVTWTPIYGRLGTRMLSTVTLCISFVGWPSQDIYFGFPLARSKWSILLRIVRLPLQQPFQTVVYIHQRSVKNGLVTSGGDTTL